MIFFLARENFYLQNGPTKRQFWAAPHPDMPLRTPPDRIYCTTVLDLKKLEDRFLAAAKTPATAIIPEDRIRESARFPRELGISNRGELEREQMLARAVELRNSSRPPPRTADLKKQIRGFQNKEINIALFNGVGTGIGDTIMGLTALDIVHRQLKRSFARVNVDALVGPHCFESVQPVYAQSPVIRAVHALPVTLADFGRYDAFFDTGSLMHRDDADRLPYVDFILKQFGIDYWKVDRAQKRNRLRLDQEATAELARELDAMKDGGQKWLLFHPAASGPLRSVPEDKIVGMMEAILAHSDYRIVTVVPVPFRHERVIDMTDRSKSFQHLCCIVSRVDAILTVDTSIYHIADAFDIPALVLFSTIDPALRVKYYPTVRGMLLPGARESGYFGRHTLRPGEAADPVYRLWDGINIEKMLDEIDRLAKKAG